MAIARVGAARSANRAPRTKLAARRRATIGLLAVPLVVYTAFIVYPLIRVVGLSLWHWDGLGAADWAGFENYVAIFEDKRLREAFIHALILIVFYAIIPLIIGLPLASILVRSRAPGLPVFRTIVFLPQVIAMTVLAIAWREIYRPNGALNTLLGWVGIDTNRAWLGEFDTALIAVGFVGTWVSTGLVVVLLMSGMANVDETYYEAGALDGLGPVGKFWHITLPAVRAEMLVALTLTTINALKTFDLVYMTTSGGPGTATTVPSFEVYYRAFRVGEVGTAASLAVVLTIVIFVINVAINVLGEREK